MEPEVFENYLKSSEDIIGWIGTGSYFICDPPVTNTDIDYVIHTQYFSLPDTFCKNPFLKEYNDLFMDSVFEYTGHDYGTRDSDEALFFTYRWEKYNLILVNNENTFRKWKVATREAKKLNLLNKSERIQFFDDVFNNLNKYDTPKPIEWI